MAPKGEPKRRVKLTNPPGDTGKISNNIEPIRGNLNEHIYIYIMVKPEDCLFKKQFIWFLSLSGKYRGYASILDEYH